MDASPDTPASKLLLTDGGIETSLIFDYGLDLPEFAAFPLVEHAAGRAALRSYFEPFLDLARDRGVGFVISTPTWRANADWGALLGYDAAGLATANRRSVAFADELRRSAGSWGAPVLVEGIVGPRGDAPGMSSAEAERYHAAQVAAFAAAGADQVTALTIDRADEAVGIVRAAGAVGLPVVLSFTVETDGRLASGQALRAAIEQVDVETDGAAAAFMVNCAHPTHFASALADAGTWLERIQGLRANASTRSHGEIDEADDLDTGDPVDLAARHLPLRALLPNLTVLGGCCGTDVRHVSAIADAYLGDPASITGA